MGWNSPKPAATRCWGETPLADEEVHTAIARAAESPSWSERGDWIVHAWWPSTRNTQAMSGVDLAFELLQGVRQLLHLGLVGVQRRLALREQHFGLEDGSGRPPPGCRAPARDLAQAAEELVW